MKYQVSGYSKQKEKRAKNFFNTTIHGKSLSFYLEVKYKFVSTSPIRSQN